MVLMELQALLVQTELQAYLVPMVQAEQAVLQAFQVPMVQAEQAVLQEFLV